MYFFYSSLLYTFTTSLGTSLFIAFITNSYVFKHRYHDIFISCLFHLYLHDTNEINRQKWLSSPTKHYFIKEKFKVSLSFILKISQQNKASSFIVLQMYWFLFRFVQCYFWFSTMRRLMSYKATPDCWF